MPPLKVIVAVMVQLPVRLLPAAAATTCQLPLAPAQQQDSSATLSARRLQACNPPYTTMLALQC